MAMTALFDAIQESHGMRGRVIDAMCDALGSRPALATMTNKYCDAAQKAHNMGDVATREQHFDALVMMLAYVARKRDIDFAVEFLEPTIYNRVVKLTEDDDEVHAKMQRIVPIMTELGRHVAERINA